MTKTVRENSFYYKWSASETVVFKDLFKVMSKGDENLGTYGLERDPNNEECTEIDLLDNCEDFDAEIIDYGISEDISPILIESSTSSRNSPNEYALNSFDSSLKINCACVKIVDCDKYPWYYAKYKNQILKRKYSDAINNVRTVIDGIQNDESDPPIAIDFKQNSVSTENTDNISIENTDNISIENTNNASTENTNNVSTVNTNNDLEKSFFVHNTLFTKNKCSISNQNLIKEQMSENRTNLKMIDIKKNQGLVGMKIQKIKDFESSIKETKIKVKRKVQVKKKNRNIGQNCFDTENLQTKTNAVLNKTKKLNASDANKSNNIGDSNKSEEVQLDGLQCSLDLNAQKIVMKIKKIESLSPSFKDTSGIQKFNIKENLNTDCQPVSTNDVMGTSKFNHESIFNLKPKSKKIAVDRRKNKYAYRENLKIQNQSNNKIELSQNNPKQTISIPSNSYYKLKKNDGELMHMTFLKAKHKKSKHLSKINNLKQKVNILKITPKSTNNISKIEQELKMNTINKTKKLSIRPIMYMSYEPLTPMFPKIVQDFVCKNKIETSHTNSSLFDDKPEIASHNFANPNISYIKINYDCPVVSENMDTQLPSEKITTSSPVSQVPNAVTTTSFTKYSKEVKSYKHQQNRETGSQEIIKKEFEYNNSFNSTKDAAECNMSNFQSTNCPPQFTSTLYSQFGDNVVPTTTNQQKITNFYSETTQSEKIKENNIEKNKFTKTIYQVTEPCQVSAKESLQVFDTKSPKEKNKNIAQPGISNIWVESDASEQMEFYKKPFTLPPTPIATTMPCFPKQQEDNVKLTRRTSSHETAFNVTQTARHKLPTPVLPPQHMSYAVRPHYYPTQMPNWTNNQYQPTNYAYPSWKTNYQHVPCNRYMESQNAQNMYNQHNNNNFYSNYHQKTPSNIHVPPGICNVSPNNVNWQHNNVCCPSVPPAQYPQSCSRIQQPKPPLPPHSYISINSDEASVIGQDDNGVITKINIPKSDARMLGNKNTNKNIAKTSKIKDANGTDTSYGVSDMPISIKSEMPELRKVMMAVDSQIIQNKAAKTPNHNIQMSTKPAENTKNRFSSPLTNRIQSSGNGYSPPIAPIQTLEEIIKLQLAANMLPTNYFSTPTRPENVSAFPYISPQANHVPLVQPKLTRRKSLLQKCNTKKYT